MLTIMIPRLRPYLVVLMTATAILSAFFMPVLAHSVQTTGVAQLQTEARMAQSDVILMDRASKMIEQDRFEQAIPLLDNAVSINPVNILALYNLAYCHYELAKVQTDSKQTIAHLRRAEMLFERVQNLNPNFILTYFKLGKIALLLQEPEKAAAYYRMGLEYEPGNAALIFNLARIYDTGNQSDMALAYYQKALDIDPDFIYAYNNMGLLYEQKKDYRSAEKAYQAALKKDKTYNYARLNLGNLYSTLNRPEEARGLFKEALKYEPDNAWAHLYLGNQYIVEENYQQAVNHYYRFTKIEPDYALVYYLLALSLSKLERYDEAMTASQRYIDLEPEGPHSTELRGFIVALKIQQAGGSVLLKKAETSADGKNKR